MIIEYDSEEMCIYRDDEALTFSEACRLRAELEKALEALEDAIPAWERDHTTTDNPDGHNDDF